MTGKTDNHNPKAKLDLRRYFLSKYHADASASVLDCCQGGGVMWYTLRDEFPIKSYWGVDVKPKKGRLKIDSVRILAQPGWTQNVIDVDTYGSPWKHWYAMLPNIATPTTVFLTVGRFGPNLVSISAIEFAAIGLTIDRVKHMPGMCSTLAVLVVNYVLTSCCNYGKMITEAVEAVSDGNARYIGVRIEPIKTPAEQVETAKRAEPKQAEMELAHV